jgi:fructokinase/2-dehydro-3-deoxygluconokinase
MVLREADVVWCSAHDLFGLGMDVVTLRASLRPGAVLVASNGAGSTSASGPFGEVARTTREASVALDEGGAFTAAICAELAKIGHAHEGSLWARALQRAESAIAARAGR